MRSKRSILLLLVLSLVLGSCAGPEKLTRKSREELAAGHVQNAYDRARKALDKDASYGPAIQAMADAGEILLQQQQDRVMALAAARDTLGACDALLRMDAFRLQLADYSVNLPSDPGFRRTEQSIRAGGADIHYRMGMREESDGRPRRAYEEYVAANAIFPGYRDVVERIRTTGEAAIAVVAILPWSNQTDVSGLSMDLTNHIYEEVGRRVTPRDFRFTILMGRDEVYERIPISALDALSRDQAIGIGREIGADLVVVGRVFGLRSQNNTIDYTQTVYRPRTREEAELAARNAAAAGSQAQGAQGQGQGNQGQGNQGQGNQGQGQGNQGQGNQGQGQGNQGQGNQGRGQGGGGQGGGQGDQGKGNEGKGNDGKGDEGKGGQGQGNRSDLYADYVAEQVHLVRREMNLEIQYEFMVIDTRTGETVARHTDSVPASVATIYSSFRPVGPRKDYRLYPPGLAKAEPQNAQRIDTAWRTHVGDWGLLDFLEMAFESDEYSRYRSRDRSRILNYRSGHPVFLGGLPPEDDVARLALDRVWVPVLGTLKDLDR